MVQSLFFCPKTLSNTYGAFVQELNLISTLVKDKTVSALMSNYPHLERQQPKAGTHNDIIIGKENKLEAVDGAVLYYKCWNAAGETKAILYFVHGLAEHIRRYDGMFKIFNDNGIRVHAFDHRGHGRTLMMNKAMAKGHVGDLSTINRDIELLLAVDDKQQTGGNVPRFLVTKTCLSPTCNFPHVPVKVDGT